MLQPKRPKRKAKNVELPSITLFEPVLSTKPTRHHVPLDEVALVPLLPVAPTPPKPKSPVRAIDKVTTALGFKASHLAHRVVVRPLFEERKELQAELAQEILDRRLLEDEEQEGQDVVLSPEILHASHDIFQTRVLQQRLDNAAPDPAPLPSTTGAIGGGLVPSPSDSNLTTGATLSAANLLRSTISLASLGAGPSPPMRSQKSNASLAETTTSHESNDAKPHVHGTRRRSGARDRPRTREKPLVFSGDHSHVVFMAPERVLHTSKRQSLPTSPSVASIKRQFQKLLVSESRAVPATDASGPLDCVVSIFLFSNGDVIVGATEKPKFTSTLPTASSSSPVMMMRHEPRSLTLPAPDAARLFVDEDVEVYSPAWAQMLLAHIAIDKDHNLTLPTPASRHIVLTMHQDTAASPTPVAVTAIAVHDGLSLMVLPPPDAKGSAGRKTSPFHVHLTIGELERIILRMDNMHVSEEHVRQLVTQKAWCAMFLHDMPLVELLVAQRQTMATHPVSLDNAASVAVAAQPTPPPPDSSPPQSHTVAAIMDDDDDAIDDAIDDDEAFGSEELANVCRIARTLAGIAVHNTLLWIQKQEAAALYSTLYTKVRPSPRRQSATSVHTDTVLAAYQDKEYERRAIFLLVDDMIMQLLHYDCRVELHVAKADGGYNDYIATRIQSAFRMSIERRKYSSHQRVRHSAAKLIQTLQRGVSARKRYIEKKLERERYLYFGFRSSLVTQFKLDSPVDRLQKRTSVMESRRVTFLMGVVTGAFLFNKPATTPATMLPLDDVVALLDTHGILVGCPATMGQRVHDAIAAHHPDAAHHPPREVVSVQTVQTALVSVLRTLADDTFGRPAPPPRRSGHQSNDDVENGMPPRWLLKATPALHASNLARLVALRQTKLERGRQAAYLIAYHYRVVLRSLSLERCRDGWHQDMLHRYEETCMVAQFSVHELVGWGMEKLQEAVKVWGWDGDAMFEIFNVCLTHRLGKQALRLLETKFSEFASAMNNRAKKTDVYPLRDEINDELEGFDKLLALRCLNFGYDDHVTPASEMLHVLLHTRGMSTDHLRLALPTVLPVATYLEKVTMATRLLADYANELYGHALILLLWSTLDAAENATLEAGQLLEKLSKVSDDGGGISPLARALQLVTGSHLYRLLEFCVKVCPLNDRVRDAIRLHMAPYVQDALGDGRGMKLESHRMCLTLCHMADEPARRHLVASRLARSCLRESTAFWDTYERLFGEMDLGYAQVSMESPS
ncbi:Aste57867_10620 [Aphanomyces stellatus]|uniref:Aste57867_10620 protein n=1 Tax=Aphanomyces stellatus TaxID=120398 RepID=A0A485KQW5_9STRA|nr:hypothetical protein As57867_010580 [Aphanomyces stellatus]VFT87492.1 Aste57867_10620 [Aphanomyces stellatus]